MSEAAGGIVQLSWFDLGLASGLILVAGGVSVGLGLGLERRLGIAALRTAVQLLIVGFVLKSVFALDAALPVLALMGVMVLAASRAAAQRSSRSYPGAVLLSFLTLAAVGFLITFVVTGVIVRIDPWYRPQYVIPLLGMILGNSLTGISLCLDQLLEHLDLRRGEIESALALGASSWEAARGPMAEGVRRGMIPIINSMMVVGLVSLPGMMTGQIIANADPLVAVRYQIVVMFMIAAATALGSMGIALLTYRRCFNARHQLRTGFIIRK